MLGFQNALKTDDFDIYHEFYEYMKRSGLPPLRALQVFDAAARHGNFSRAADELAITQSAVSRQVLQLEQALGRPLFERRGPNLALTDAGQAYAEVVRDSLSMLRRGTARLFAKSRSPLLTVTTLPSFASRWLVPRLSGFETRHPGVSVRIAASFELADFDLDTDIDVAIRYGRGDWPGLFVMPLVDELLFPVCSPNLASRIRTPDDLASQRLLFEGRRFDQWRRWSDATGLAVELKPRDRLSDDFNIQLQAAMLGQGVALGRSLLVADDLRAGRLVCPVRMPVRSKVQYHFVCPEERAGETPIKKFSGWLADAAADSIAGLDKYVR